jgi:hypothetical protein
MLHGAALLLVKEAFFMTVLNEWQLILKQYFRFGNCCSFSPRVVL